MKTIAAIVLLSSSSCAFAQDKRAISAAEAGCGPQDAKFEVKSDGSQHPTVPNENAVWLGTNLFFGKHLQAVFDI